MTNEYRPLYAAAVAVLVAGVVTGLAFAGVSDRDVFVGTTVLAALMVVLYLLSRRHRTHHDHM